MIKANGILNMHVGVGRIQRRVSVMRPASLRTCESLQNIAQELDGQIWRNSRAVLHRESNFIDKLLFARS